MGCAGVKLWFTVYFFQVTGYHRHVGTVADTAADPDFASFSWATGEAFARPRQAVALSLIAASTAAVFPKLADDYSHVAQGIEKAVEAAQLLRTFRASIQEVAGTIEGRNKRRPFP